MCLIKKSRLRKDLSQYLQLYGFSPELGFSTGTFTGLAEIHSSAFRHRPNFFVLDKGPGLATDEHLGLSGITYVSSASRIKPRFLDNGPGFSRGTGLLDEFCNPSGLWECKGFLQRGLGLF